MLMVILGGKIESKHSQIHQISPITIFLYIESIPHPFVNIQEERKNFIME